MSKINNEVAGQVMITKEISSSSQGTTTQGETTINVVTDTKSEEGTTIIGADEAATVDEATVVDEAAVVDEAIVGDETIVTEETNSDAAVLEETTEGASEGEVAVEGEVTETVPIEGSEDVASEGEVVIDAATEEMLMKEGININESGGDISYEGGMTVDPGFGTEMPDVKNPLLSSWIFVIGITAAVLVVSIVLGALLAKRKIKKGIELYED